MRIKPRTKALVFSFFFLLGLLILIEAGFQLAGWLFARGRARPTNPQTKVIVCLGDSHTYGVFVNEEEAYPSQLEQILNRSGKKYQVVNLGAPGQNSTQILKALPKIIEKYHPEIILLLVGVNNGWNIAGQEQSFWEKLAGHFKLYKFFRLIYFHYFKKERSFMVTKRRDSGELLLHKERKEAPSSKIEILRIEKRFFEDLLEIIKFSRQQGVRIVLLNYPGDKETNYLIPNHLLKKAGAKTEAVFIDLYSYFLHLLYDEKGTLNQKLHSQLFFPDMHLRPQGYYLMAERIFQVLEEKGLFD